MRHRRLMTGIILVVLLLSLQAIAAPGDSSPDDTSFSSLVGATDKDGSVGVTMSCSQTTLGRVKASGVGSIFFDISDSDFAVVPRPPTINVAANGGAVDENCELVVAFSATVVDDCGVNSADVLVEPEKVTANFTLGAVAYNVIQIDPQHVTVSGSAIVSDVFDSPAKLAIHVRGANACGAPASNSVEVEVADVTPPSISVAMDPARLWPPNHSLRKATALVMTMDNCPSTTFVLSSATSSEPDNGLGDGNTTMDIQGATLETSDLSLFLRAERSGMGPGRTYTLTYIATDASDNETSASGLVLVPHSNQP